MISLLKRYRDDISGATAIEYAMLAGLIGLGIITAADSLGWRLNVKYWQIRRAIINAGV